MVVGLPGRLSKGAGTHLASWLQEVSNVLNEEANLWLEQPKDPRTANVFAALTERHGKSAGHSQPIIDAAVSGELLATKDAKSMRLWRARDGALLRVVSACPGKGVAFSPTGNNIVTGTCGTAQIKVWGPAGNSAVGCGNTKITVGRA
mmetsp:Transcript_18753/g.30093  ORF Transcript_18753/g.30093 Transcript_18753/m.30093 type:complete len:148 (+) Transcript_18753:80-523(+)